MEQMHHNDGVGENAPLRRLRSYVLLARRFREADELRGLAESGAVGSGDEQPLHARKEVHDQLQQSLASVFGVLDSVSSDRALRPELLRICFELMTTKAYGERVRAFLAMHHEMLRDEIQRPGGDVSAIAYLLYEQSLEGAVPMSHEMQRLLIDDLEEDWQVHFASLESMDDAMRAEKFTELIQFAQFTYVAGGLRPWVVDLCAKHVHAILTTATFDWKHDALAQLRTMGLRLGGNSQEGAQSRSDIGSELRPLSRYLLSSTLSGVPSELRDAIMRSVCAACSFGSDVLDELEYAHEPVVYGSGAKVLSQSVQEQWYLMVSMYHVLEKLEPGIVKNLRERYGIRWPHRYSLRTLIYQHLQVHAESPFVLLVSAAADTANAFLDADEYDFYLELQKNLDRDGTGMRVVECAGKSDLQTYTASIATEAKNKPIPVTIIRTHAHKKHFELGYGEDGELDTADIKNGQLDALIAAMEPAGSIILDGCGLGLKSGVAEVLSKQFPQGYVYAPKTREAGIKSIDDTAKKLGSRALTVTYTDKQGAEHPARIFHNGRELKQVQ